MPCTKCEDGKYKWGKTGECEYSSKEACESANSKYSKMKPTPLGKKTYEEYEKELKEFNLSKVERVNLGIVDEALKLQDKVVVLRKEAKDKIMFIFDIEDSVDKLVKKINGMRSDIVKQLNVYDSEVGYYRKANKDLFGIGSNLESNVSKLETKISELTKASKELGVKIPSLKGLQETAKTGAVTARSADEVVNGANLPEKPSQSF